VTPRVLVTGATGFIGTAVSAQLLAEGKYRVREALRSAPSNLAAGADRVVVGPVTGATDWRTALAEVSAVVHLAARAHVGRDGSADPLAEFRVVNVAGTLNLARQAAAAGIERFIFLSSVKVHGETGTFREADPPAPADAYGMSKHEAEEGLRRIAAETGLELVIIRPPLVYGQGVKANFRALMRAVARGVPLPLGGIRNRRSLVALDNLVDVILVSLQHPAAVNETFLVSDGEDVSTPDLIRRLAAAMGCKARLISVSPAVLLFAATLLGRRDAARRLVGSLQVDISRVRQVLDWAPRVSVDVGIRRAVASL